jgi:hypothetical protein
MGMALGRGNGDYFGVSYSLWAAMLEFAERWGWRPAGTEPPQGIARVDWKGSYYSSDGQRCRDEDARGLADAIDRFLDGEAPPSTVPPDDEDRKRLCQFMAGVSKSLDAPLCHPVSEAGDWLGSTEGREYLRCFVQFCRGGWFELW